MQLEENKSYFRTETIRVEKNQKLRWTIFILFYGLVLFLTYLVKDSYFNGLVTGFIFATLVYLIVAIRRDKTVKWFTRELLTEFKEIKK